MIVLGVVLCIFIKMEKMVEHWVQEESGNFPELMHRLAARNWPPGDVGDNAEGVLFVIERVMRVSGSLA